MARQDLRRASPCKHGYATQPECGLASGTIIYTTEGALPVEFLIPGDRVITRAGARVLQGVVIKAGGCILSFGNPEGIYADGIETLAA